jgi:excisionase family DNA binding protein
MNDHAAKTSAATDSKTPLSGRLTFKEFGKTNGRGPMTVKEASDYLKVSKKTVRCLCHRGLIRYSKSLRKWLLLADDVEKFVERTC